MREREYAHGHLREKEGLFLLVIYRAQHNIYVEGVLRTYTLEIKDLLACNKEMSLFISRATIDRCKEGPQDVKFYGRTATAALD